MYLVTGATGTVGRLLVEQLLAEGAKVGVVTRDPEVAGLPGDVDIVVGDSRRPETIVPYLDGATGLFIHSRAVADAAPELVALAKERGVRRFVALSAMNVDDDLDAQPSRFRGDRNKEAEDAVVGSGLEWVSLRAGAFAVNSLNMWGAQIRAGDVVRGPYANFAESPVHERDLAAVAARALLGDELIGRRPVLTGSQSLTHAELVAVIGAGIGRPLRYEEVPAEAAAQRMIQQGVAEPFVVRLMSRYAEGAGKPAPISGEVEEILGRPALTFAEWVAEHSAAFQG